MGIECYLDSSAVVTLLWNEERAEAVKVRLRDFDRLVIGAPTLAECLMVLSGRTGRDERGQLDRFVRSYAIEVEPFGPQHYRVASEAFLRYGKCRHPARLNFGDCLAYAGASLAGLPLLYVGGDFALTDVEPALESH